MRIIDRQTEAAASPGMPAPLPEPPPAAPPLLVALLVTLLGVNLTGVAFCVLVAWRRELRVCLGRYRGLNEETVELRSETAVRAPPQASGEGGEGTSKPAAEAEGEEAVIL